VLDVSIIIPPLYTRIGLMAAIVYFHAIPSSDKAVNDIASEVSLFGAQSLSSRVL